MRTRLGLAMAALTTVATVPAHASYSSGSDCVNAGGTVIEHGWVYGAYPGVYSDLSYKQVDSQTTWLCGRVFFVNGGENAVKIIVQTPPELGPSAVPTIDGDLSSCGTDLVAGDVGPDRLPYRLGYSATATTASVCLVAGVVGLRLVAPLPSGQVPTPPSVTVEPTILAARPDNNDEIFDPPTGQPSDTCGALERLTVLGYRISAGSNGGLCIRAATFGGRLDFTTQGVPWVYASTGQNTDFSQCDVSLWSSTAPVRAHVSYESTPGSNGKQQICIDNDEQPIGLEFVPLAPDPNDPPTVTFTPDS